MAVIPRHPGSGKVKAQDMDEEQVRRRFEAAMGSYTQDFGTFFIVRLLGLELDYPDEACVVSFPVDDFLYNPQGSYHGGMLATVMDISMGHLIKRTTGLAGITLEMKSQYLRPLTSGPARCEGRFLRRGRSVSFLESRVVDANARLVAHATATWKMGEKQT